MQLRLYFEAALGRLLPSGLPPRLALAVSGGADSTALAVLARDYCNARNGCVLALIVDHGLRAESAQEARETAARLQQLEIQSSVLTLRLAGGSAMQDRARVARYQALATASLSAGFMYLLLGHHQADQYETVAMRMQRGNGGAEGMAAWTVRHDIVLLRPLLGVQPALLRAFLQEQGVEWAEDPSNQLQRFERVRIRQNQSGLPPTGGDKRAAREQESADFLARHGIFSPDGYALLDVDSVPVAALGVLLRTIGGRIYAPRQDALKRLAAGLRPATLGGVRIAQAGRLGKGWVFMREPAACAPPVQALAAVTWDERFTLLSAGEAGMTLGALGKEACLFKGYKRLPAMILQSLPALRTEEGTVVFPASVRFSPSVPMAARPFLI